MGQYQVLIATGLCIMSPAIATAASVSLPVSTIVQTNDAPTSLITPSPLFTFNEDLRKRKENSVSVCGVGNTGNYFHCGESTEWCRGSVLADGRGYIYCSTYQVVDQTAWTAAVANWKGHCPKSTICCYADEKDKWPVTALFHVSSYDFTMTGWFCTDEPDQTLQYHAVQRVLDPTSVSAALASLAAATSMSSSLSSSEKIGIGVGVGVGGLLILVLGLAIFVWRRRRARKQDKRHEIGDTRVQRPYEEVSYLKAQPESRMRPVELPSNQVQEMPSPMHSPELAAREIPREPGYSSKG